MPERSRKLAAILFTDIVNYTALMGSDEGRGIETVQRSRRLQKALVEQFHGEWVQEVGDGTLCTFPSAVDAVTCAIEIQRVVQEDPDLKLRIGIHEGDIVVEGSDVYGDGVNVASRIQALAPEGGITVSEKVYDEVHNKPEIEATFLGAKELKNVDRPVRVYSLSIPGSPQAEGPRELSALRRWIRRHPAVAGVTTLAVLVALLYGYTNRAAIQVSLIVNLVPVFTTTFEQEIEFVTARDGVQVAYSTVGSGPPLVQVLGWFTHLEKGLSSPAFGVAPGWPERFQFVRFDGRGTGLSDRGITDFSMDARVSDLEAVVDALGLDRFSIVAHSAGGPLAISYTVKHPERVNRIAFYGSFARMAQDRERYELIGSMVPMVRTGWGADSPAFRQVFTSLFMPDGDELDLKLFNEWQRIAADPADAANFLEALLEVDVRPLARQIRSPALVIHRRGDAVVPYPLGRELASLIPGARLLTLEGNNHAFTRGEPEIFEMLNAVEEFVLEGSAPAGIADTQ
jgi:class 3 adenylate cyclase/pimeloyl-ACP methyl ester carboxylesterase